MQRKFLIILEREKKNLRRIESEMRGAIKIGTNNLLFTTIKREKYQGANENGDATGDEILKAVKGQTTKMNSP